MSKKTGYMRRYVLIINTIRKNNYVSKDELIAIIQWELANYGDELGISDSTIKRDLQDIRNIIGLDIKYSKRENGYYIQNEDDMKSDFETILDAFNLCGVVQNNKGLPDFFYPEKHKFKGSEYLQPLVNAIKLSKRVEFRYRKFDNTVTKDKRTVEPYALKQFKGRWYLLAVEVGGRPEEWGTIKTWGLDRIENFSTTPIVFNKNPRLSIDDEFKNPFGIFSDEDKQAEEVILSFKPESGKYNATLPLHESQETLIDNADEFRIKLNVKITYDFIMELLAQSENMKVIAPLHLKEQLIKIHKHAIENLEK